MPIASAYPTTSFSLNTELEIDELFRKEGKHRPSQSRLLVISKHQCASQS
jgi:hypothetical protein